MNVKRILACAALSVAAALSCANAWGETSAGGKKVKNHKEYSVVILGDTHFDTEPASVYHSNYSEPTEWLNRVQRAEFARNGEMWRERCPRLLDRASRLVGPDTRMAFQLGDLVQGDCGKGDVHQKMLDDVMNNFKAKLGSLPFITVAGNHDIRGVDARATYDSYMPGRMSRELGQKIEKTTFGFRIGPDAYIAIDFNDPDDEEIEKLLKEAEGARYTFVLSHGGLFPIDSGNCRWFFHGGENDTDKRLHFRKLFAGRNVICLCGHSHYTEIIDWYGDGGRITQFTGNSVWSSPKLGEYVVRDEGADKYGERRKGNKNADGSDIKDETALFDEYRPGLKTYRSSVAAGSYLMKVSDSGVTVEFYGGDSETPSEIFKLR